MTGPNMATITASLQNCSLNHQRRPAGARVDREGSSSTTSGIDPPENLPDVANSGEDDATFDLNSHISLPYHWEQCLDLKTGEIYYINWRNGTKSSEDPRLSASPEYSGGDYYYSDDDSSYDSEESSSESSPLSGNQHCTDDGDGGSDQLRRTDQKNGAVLVVAGCKSCLMYYMVPKPVGDCPKCSGQLLHFDRSDDGSA